MDKILQLITLPVACEENSSLSFRTALIAAIRNGNAEQFEKQISAPITAKAYSLVSGTASVTTANCWELDDVNLPENSIALISIEGMIYPWRMFQLEQLIAAVNANPKLLGALLFVNTPGGYVLRVDIASAAIRDSIKPIAAYVTGMCASAGEYLVCGCRRIFTASRTDVHGSIGTMTSYMNMSGYWKEMGIEMHDIYATLSTRKNDQSREADKGNDQPIIDNLDFYNTLFHETISATRGIAIDPENEVFQGATFFAEDAIQRKLVDEVGSLETALDWVLTEGLKNEANHNY